MRVLPTVPGFADEQAPHEIVILVIVKSTLILIAVVLLCFEPAAPMSKLTHRCATALYGNECMFHAAVALHLHMSMNMDIGGKEGNTTRTVDRMSVHVTLTCTILRRVTSLRIVSYVIMRCDMIQCTTCSDRLQ